MFHKISLAAISLVLASSAFADTTAVDAIFASVDLSTVTTFIGGAGATIVGIALALKGISLAKRLVGKA